MSRKKKLLSYKKNKKTNKNKKVYTKKNLLYCGKITQHPNGFGFVAVEGKKTQQADCYVPKKEMNGAIHGDVVQIRKLSSTRRGRPEFSVIKILQAAPDILCGILRQKKEDFFVVPDNSRIPFRVRINPEDLTNAKPGDVVQVHFQRGSGKRVPGKIIAVLGLPSEIDTQMQLAIEQFALPHIFSADAIAQAKSFIISEKEYQGRIDLRKTAHITIDGKTAKDFDDAIYLEKNGENIRLFVSIADVSYYVQNGSILDKEAYERGTSVYFPGRVIPMLPEELSNNLCSLVPDEDRLTVTCEMEFNSSGKMITKKLYRSVICSKQRFTYTRVEELLQKKSPGRDTTFLPMLKNAAELASSLRKRRLQRGAIDFNLQEPLYKLDDNGYVTAIERGERNDAHRLIEEFMLIANEAVAQYLSTQLEHPIYRIHEKPDTMKIKDFQQFAGRLGKILPKYTKESSWFREVLQQFATGRYEYIINTLLLRTLSQARYSCEETGHFGLASIAYTHFTSPIRRYPDLIVHRMLIATLEKKEAKKSGRQNFAPDKTKEAAEFLSKRERVAVDAERDMNERLKVGYMKDKLGEHFQAIISGVTENSLFIELISPCVNGAIPIEMLGDDYFFFDEKNFRLFGELSKREYQLGDKIEVVLVDISMTRRQLTFAVKL